MALKTGPAASVTTGRGKSAKRVRQFATACLEVEAIAAISFIPTKSVLSVSVTSPFMFTLVTDSVDRVNCQLPSPSYSNRRLASIALLRPTSA